jgi:glycosyltransferase involved in cell wall biosynthesis
LSEEPVLLTVGMMRPGDKLASYSLLGEALAMLQGRPWRLLVAGDGPARAEVHQALAATEGRIVWLGELEESHMPAVYASADLFIWPAIREAWGMALLEAQGAGLPAVAGRSGGVTDIVEHGHSGILVRARDAREFALAIASLLDDAPRRRMMGQTAQARVRQRHDIEIASQTMNAVLHQLVETRNYA